MGILLLMEDEDGFRIIIETQTNVSILLEKFGKMETHMADRLEKMEIRMAEIAKAIPALPCDVHKTKIEHMEETFKLQGKLPCDAHTQQFKTIEGQIKWGGRVFGAMVISALLYIGGFFGMGPKAGP